MATVGLRNAAIAGLVLSAACKSAPSGGAGAQAPSPKVALAALAGAQTLDGDKVPTGERATIAILFASWCGYCREELAIVGRLLPRHPGVVALGVNYRPHEEYDGRGDAAAVRAFVAENAPWLTVVPADETLFAALGSPPKVPTLWVFDSGGSIVATFDRRFRPPATEVELEAALAATVKPRFEGP